MKQQEKILEKQIEQKLKERVENAGGLCIKLGMTYAAGMPDRLCLFPTGISVFVEVKAPGKKPRPIQEYVHDWLRTLGFVVLVIDNYEGIDKFMETYSNAK